MRWFAAWEAAWERSILGRPGHDFERMKFAVNHGMAPLLGVKTNG